MKNGDFAIEIYTYNMDISGNIEQLKKLKEFMTLNGIEYVNVKQCN